MFNVREAGDESDGGGEKIREDAMVDLERELGVRFSSWPEAEETSVNTVCAVNTLSLLHGSFRSLRCE